MKGYKVFNSDWNCRDFQYEVGKIYEMEENPVLCGKGFHYCKKAVDCFNYYSFNPNNKVAEVEALGIIETKGDKSATNKIKIVKEIKWSELLELVNTGKGNTGKSNSGDSNSGDRNSGNRNSGDCNSGNWNSGDRNSGDWNSGDRNSGDSNSGNRNSGDWNSGNRNSGDWNSGNRNSGDRNSGNRNSGDRNSGDWNSGNRNSGDWNSGDRNSGNRNSGDWNSGHFNISDNNSGCFNLETHNIKLFDKESDMTLNEFECSEAWGILCRIKFNPTVWVFESDMTELEKESNPSYKTTGGFLKKNDLSQVNQKWWDSLNDREKQVIRDIPNYEEEKFVKIMGIKM